jgi:hypothetical protein
MKRGWIKLYRKLSDNKLWTSQPFTRGQAWVDMLLLANHKDGCIYVRGNRLDVLRGQLGWSQLSLAGRWGWSRGKVKRFINELEIDQQIVQQNSHLSTIITIINYDEYQENGQQIVQQTDSRRTADGQQTDTNNNDKNVNNEKKEDTKRFIKPSLEEVQEYITEKGYNVDAEQFIAHYKKVGWKVGKFHTPMKCWKSAVVTWAKNVKKERFI